MMLNHARTVWWHCDVGDSIQILVTPLINLSAINFVSNINVAKSVFFHDQITIKKYFRKLDCINDVVSEKTERRNDSLNVILVEG